MTTVERKGLRTGCDEGRAGGGGDVKVTGILISCTQEKYDIMNRHGAVLLQKYRDSTIEIFGIIS